MSWTWPTTSEMRLDVEVACADLKANRLQAWCIAAYALAWRLTPIGAVAAGAVLLLAVAASTGTAGRVSWSFLPLCGPLVVTSLFTFPATFIAAAQGLRTSRQGTDRFSFGGTVFVYYGWRYAFRGRSRPWGALRMSA